MTDTTAGRPARRIRLLPASVAIVVGLALAVAVALALAPEPAPTPLPMTTPAPISGAAVGAGSPTPAPVRTDGVRAEAERLRDMDPVKVARSVASEDAAAKRASGAASAVKGVWRVGAVGTYLVGKGMAPGTYESAGATQGECHWARLQDLDGKATSVIEVGSGVGRNVVTIEDGDGFFETSHCQNWHKIA